LGQLHAIKNFYCSHFIKKFSISFIGVDSFQIYKRFNIGSAKPTEEILEKIQASLS
jgi:tRNA delta(2)-isopentenylpyrophosphate transferase